VTLSGKPWQSSAIASPGLILSNGRTAIDSRSCGCAGRSSLRVSGSGVAGATRKNANGPGNVFQVVLTEILKANCGAPTDLLHHDLRYQNLIGLRQRFQARCDVYATPVNVIAIENHIAKIDSDSKAKPEIRRIDGTLYRHRFFDFHRASESVSTARKFNKHPVAREFHDPTAMRDVFGVNDCLALRFYPRERARLVLAHESAIINDVSGHDGCESALKCLGWHRV